MIKHYMFALVVGITASNALAMTEYRIVANKLEDGSMQLHKKEINPPTFNLVTCAQCNANKVEIICPVCEGTMYCTQGCQQAHWDAHQRDCEKISKAQDGDLVQTFNFINAYIDAYQKTRKKEYVYKAIKSQCVLIYRCLQDAACIKEKKNKKTMQQEVHAACWQQDNCLRQLMEKAKISIEDENNIAIKALKWTEDHTNDSMNSPEGILYFSSTFGLNENEDTSILFSGQDTWQERREKVLIAEREKLEKWQQDKEDKNSAVDNNT
jgi:hypothetical protein